MAQARAQAPIAAPRYNRWTLPGDVVWADFHRGGRGYLVRFPGLADFEISADALVVTCHPTAGTAEETCRHLFLNQVEPLATSRRGELVFHASAVEIDAKAVAFVGRSGRGKSTLAASFASSGHRFLSDDGLVVREQADGYLASPSHPSIRLWNDSRLALASAAAQLAPQVEHTAKLRLLAGAALQFCDEARPLTGACFLGEARGDEIRIERMTPREAAVEWCSNSFMLEPGDRRLIEGHFERVVALANRLACFRLDYPRRFEALPAVRGAIIAMHTDLHS